MAEYRLRPRAQRDLDAIFDYSVAMWGLPQAIRYAGEIEAALTDLAEAPGRGQDCGHVRPGYRRRVVERHVIYFTPAPYGIDVVRLLHQSMDFARHL